MKTRQSNSTWFAPSKFTNSVHSLPNVYAVLTAPVGHNVCYAVDRNVMVCALIAGLRCLCRPLDVTRFVMAIIIDSVQGMFRGRLRTQLGKELLKGLKAKFNTPTAVFMKAIVLWIGTALFSFKKGNVFFRAGHAVRALSGTGGFGIKTTARLYTPGAHRRSVDRHELSAVTKAFPINRGIATRRIFGASEHTQNLKASKAPTLQVVKVGVCRSVRNKISWGTSGHNPNYITELSLGTQANGSLKDLARPTPQYGGLLITVKHWSSDLI